MMTGAPAQTTHQDDLEQAARATEPQRIAVRALEAASAVDPRDLLS